MKKFISQFVELCTKFINILSDFFLLFLKSLKFLKHYMIISINWSFYFIQKYLIDQFFFYIKLILKYIFKLIIILVVLIKNLIIIFIKYFRIDINIKLVIEYIGKKIDQLFKSTYRDLFSALDKITIKQLILTAISILIFYFILGYFEYIMLPSPIKTMIETINGQFSASKLDEMSTKQLHGFNLTTSPKTMSNDIYIVLSKGLMKAISEYLWFRNSFEDDCIFKHNRGIYIKLAMNMDIVKCVISTAREFVFQKNTLNADQHEQIYFFVFAALQTNCKVVVWLNPFKYFYLLSLFLIKTYGVLKCSGVILVFIHIYLGLYSIFKDYIFKNLPTGVQKWCHENQRLIILILFLLIIFL